MGSRRPYTLLSCGMSLDGYLSGAGADRLMLSNKEDLDRVDAMRAECDAILVGAVTVRRDNPRLLVRDVKRQQHRTRGGRPASPCKVTVTASGDLDPDAAFFTSGEADRLVYCAGHAVEETRRRLDGLATVVDAGPAPDMSRISEDLHRRGVRRLMVEGGGKVHTQFLTASLADELHLVVAPLFVGDSRACRFVGDGSFPWNKDRRAGLVEARPIGEVVLLRYALSDRFAADAFPDDATAVRGVPAPFPA